MSRLKSLLLQSKTMLKARAGKPVGEQRFKLRGEMREALRQRLSRRRLDLSVVDVAQALAVQREDALAQALVVRASELVHEDEERRQPLFVNR